MSEMTPDTETATDAEVNPDAQVSQYTDTNGNVWSLNEADAKRLGYAKVENKVIVAEEDEPAAKAPARRSASTK